MGAESRAKEKIKNTGEKGSKEEAAGGGGPSKASAGGGGGEERTTGRAPTPRTINSTWAPVRACVAVWPALAHVARPNDRRLTGCPGVCHRAGPDARSPASLRPSVAPGRPASSNRSCATACPALLQPLPSHHLLSPPVASSFVCPTPLCGSVQCRCPRRRGAPAFVRAHAARRSESSAWQALPSHRPASGPAVDLHHSAVPGKYSSAAITTDLQAPSWPSESPIFQVAHYCHQQSITGSMLISLL